MNILFLTTHFNTGGITSYIETLSVEFVRSGHAVFVISSGGNRVEAIERRGVRHIRLDIRTKSILSWKLYRVIPALRSTIRELSIDVIHAHTRVTQAAASIVSRLTGVPYVVTCHGFFKPRFFRKMWPCWGVKTIAVSRQVADHLRLDFHVSGRECVIVRNGIDLKKFLVPPQEARMLAKEYFGCQNKKVLGVIARLSDVKGHAVLIKAMARIRAEVPEALLLIAGEGREGNRLKMNVQHLGLDDCVAFLSGKCRAAELLHALDCFVLPSLQEGLGLSVMEAQACGLPVVASRVGGIPSLIEDGLTGLLVEPNQPDALAEAVIRIFQDPGLAADLGVRAREKAERDYGAGQMAEKVMEVYKTLRHQDETGISS